MSKEIEANEVLKEANISLTQFFGGMGRGRCIQVTSDTTEGRGYIQLNPEEAHALAQALEEWEAKQG